jgi:hypothetical protein
LSTSWSSDSLDHGLPHDSNGEPLCHAAADSKIVATTNVSTTTNAISFASDCNPHTSIDMDVPCAVIDMHLKGFRIEQQLFLVVGELRVGLSVGRAARLPNTPDRPSRLPDKGQTDID